MLLSVTNSGQSFISSNTISTIADIVTIVGVIGVIIAIFSAMITYKEHVKMHSRKSIENAVNLARIYEKEIIYPLYSITNTFQRSSMNVFLGQKLNVRNQKTLNFTFNELVEISKDPKIEKSFLAALIGIEADAINRYKDVVIKKNPSINLNFTIGPIPSEYIKKDKKNSAEPAQGLSAEQASTLNELLSDITKLLNSLEWFAMNFHTNIADESAVYQSLHQSFISSVQYLYYFIASNNKNTYDKVYTNVEWLYNKWNQRLMETAENEAKRKKEAYDTLKRNTENIEKQIVHEPSKLK